jgi:photosystem II stability/assembly factor-like uncharacterized protein
MFKYFLLIFILSLFITNTTKADWENVSKGLYGGNIEAIVQAGDTLVVASGGFDCFYSIDQGKTWEKGKGYPFSSFIYVNGMYLGISHATTSKDVMISVDGGQNWKNRNAKFDPTKTALYQIYYYSNTLYLGTSIGLFTSTDFGKNWVQRTEEPLLKNEIYSITAKNNYVYLGSAQAVFISSYYGKTWAKSEYEFPQGAYFYSICAKDSVLIAAADYLGLFISKDNGKTWDRNYGGLTSQRLYTLETDGKDFYLGTYDKGIFKSDGDGAWWYEINNGVYNYQINKIYIHNGNIFAGTRGGGILKYSKENNFWSEINEGIYDTPTFAINSELKDTILAGVWGKGLYRSTNHGDNWQRIFDVQNNRNINAIAAKGDNIFLGSYGLYYSSDKGTTWEFPNVTNSNLIRDIKIIDDMIVIASNNGLFYSTNFGKNWKYFLNDTLIRSAIAIGVDDTKKIYVSGMYCYFTYENGDWIKHEFTPTKIPYSHWITSFLFYGSKMVFGTDFHILYSTDNGKEWDSIFVDSENNGGNYVWCMNRIQNHIFASISQIFYHSSNNGESWERIRSNNFWSYGSTVHSIAFDSLYVYCSIYGKVQRCKLTEFGIVSVENQSETTEIKIYPNPVDNYLSLDISDSEIGSQLDIYDLFGNMVYTKMLNDKQLKIDLQDLPKSIYLIKIGKSVNKFIKL